MIVKFANTFRIGGVARNRFPKGVVRDVPEVLRGHLPSSAVILPDDWVEPEIKDAENHEARALDHFRSEADREAAVLASGNAGYVDVAETEVAIAQRQKEQDEAVAKVTADAEARVAEAEARAAEATKNAEAALALLEGEGDPEKEPVEGDDTPESKAKGK